MSKGIHAFFCWLLGSTLAVLGADLVLSGDPPAIRKLNSLALIWTDIEASTGKAEIRAGFLREFMEKSGSVLPSVPDKTPSAAMMWARRTFAAIELEDDTEGAAGGRKMMSFGLEGNPDPLVQKTWFLLEQKGWLKEVHPPGIPQDGRGRTSRWTNSLGMVFTSAPGTAALFSIWETRVADFKAFTAKTGHDATKKVYSITKNQFQFRGKSWMDPGFPQTGSHPVAGVSWEDAQAFCRWLTGRERELGVIADGQAYRLPSDDEWSSAAGNEKYPWGGDLAAVKFNGNYAGLEAAGPDWPKDWGTWSDYRDDYPRTAPVGSFSPNRLGIFDLGGNVWEWCEDWYQRGMNADEVRKRSPLLEDDGGGRKYRVLRGAAWDCGGPAQVAAGFHSRNLPEVRNLNYGFRCVLSASGRETK